MKQRATLFGLLVFLINVTTQAWAQQYTALLEGRLVSVDNHPLEQVAILLKGTQTGTHSGNDGTFRLTIPAGRYTLLFSMVGKATLEKSGSAKAGSVVNLGDLRIDNADKQLTEVVVQGKSEVQQLRETGFNVTAIDAKRYANTTADVNQVLNRTTGVRIREEGGLGSNFNFSLNGLSGNHVKFFLDGVPMETFGSSLSFNNIPVNLVERMEVYKGVVPVSLGSDALGGAVNIVTNQKTAKFIDASLSYGSFNTQRVALSGQYKHPASGFLLRVNGFYNYSNNNYLMRNNPAADVSIQVIENGQFVDRDARRFHDRYRSAMGQMEVGFANKKWADYFLIGLIRSGQFKELQTARSVDVVIGEATTRSAFTMPSVKYKKNDLFIKGLSTDAYASYGTDETILTDTSSRLYGWSGQPRVVNNTAGELGDKSINHFTTTALVARANLSYQLHSTHAINVNYTYTSDQRKSYNELKKADFFNTFDIPAKLNKTIVGLAYQSNLVKSKLTTTLFSKYYQYTGFSQQIGYDTKTNQYYKSPVNATKSYVGYGLASRYKLLESLGIKASFEHACRLPDSGELFGDGLFTLANPNIRPEVSDNVNVGAFFVKRINQHRLSVESSVFSRQATDYINSMAVGAGRQSQSVNIQGVGITGFEADLKYAYANAITVGLNASYQNAIDNKEYVTSEGITVKNNTYTNRLPNQPWFYGNAEFSWGKNDVLAKNSRVQVLWLTQYVHWYYLSWEAFGSKQSHAIIPTQLTHDASVAYSMENGKYNIALECKNLTNALAYDNFRLQKPGRGVYVKLRYFFN